MTPDWSLYEVELVFLPKYQPENGDMKLLFGSLSCPELLSESESSEVLLVEGFVFHAASEIGNSATTPDHEL